MGWIKPIYHLHDCCVYCSPAGVKEAGGATEPRFEDNGLQYFQDTV